MFVRYISHEMRTPLNTAAMGLQYLRSELVKANTNIDLVDILDEVRGACEISITILNEMLDFDKLQSGLMKLEVEEIPVRDFLNTVISPFHVYVSITVCYNICIWPIGYSFLPSYLFFSLCFPRLAKKISSWSVK